MTTRKRISHAELSRFCDEHGEDYAEIVDSLESCGTADIGYPLVAIVETDPMSEDYVFLEIED